LFCFFFFLFSMVSIFLPKYGSPILVIICGRCDYYNVIEWRRCPSFSRSLLDMGTFLYYCRVRNFVCVVRPTGEIKRELNLNFHMDPHPRLRNIFVGRRRASAIATLGCTANLSHELDHPCKSLFSVFEYAPLAANLH
jgi:hypothetical protein